MIRVSGPAPQGAGPERVDRPTEMLRCGCDVYPADLHDVDDCLEALAEELAEQEGLRRSATIPAEGLAAARMWEAAQEGR